MLPDDSPQSSDASPYGGQLQSGGSSSSSLITHSISSEDLVRRWQRQEDDERRRSGRGPLTTQDKQVIALRVAQLIQEMDLGKKGHVDMEEWVHYTSLLNSDREAAQINKLLKEALKRHPHFLEDLQRLWKAADPSKAGRISFKQIFEMYRQKVWHIHPNSDLLSEAELHAGDPERFAKDIIKAMDVNGDEHVSYAEFMAFCLGRRKHQVTLHMYDLSNGMGKTLAPWILGDELEKIWHTGLVVYGREYFFASDTVHDEPGKTSFGEPTRAINLGYTLWRQDELHDFIIEELQPIFHRDTYDVVNNNCNHFADAVCMYLLGRHLPDEVLQQTECLKKLNTVKVLRPILHWWFRDGVVARDGNAQSVDHFSRWLNGESDSQLLPGSTVAIHPVRSDGPVVLGQVCSPEQLRPKAVTARTSFGDFGALSMCGCQGIETENSDEIWVRYYDIALSDTLSGCSGQVVTEMIPRSRLSAVSLDVLDLESLYNAALRAMNLTSMSNLGLNGKSPQNGPGASSGLHRPLPSLLPGSMFIEDDLDDMFLDFDLPFSARNILSNGNGHSGQGQSRDAKTQPVGKEKDSVDELKRRGFNEEAALAALSVMSWQVEEAAALLTSRDRLRMAAAGQAVCPLKPRLAAAARPQIATPPMDPSSFMEDSRPEKASADVPADPPEPPSDKSDEASPGNWGWEGNISHL
mmetsp:Transcript_6033/g.11515  ORF Transcript_6033/g.11515 Transcript_6033/m.11515 type:complete len:693 (-) Transcript_6033:91-2169(-)